MKSARKDPLTLEKTLKKFIYVFFIFLLCTSAIHAQSKSFVLNIGGTTPQTTENDSGEKIGTTGLGWSAQSFTTRNDKLHFGLETAFSYFGDNTFTYSDVKYTFKTSAISLSGIIKYSDNQANANIRPMFFGGLGLGFFVAEAKASLLPGYVWSNTGTTEKRTIVADSSIGYNVILGAGFEGDFSERYFWNMAGRYTLIGVDIEDFDRTSVSSLQFNLGFGVLY